MQIKFQLKVKQRKRTISPIAVYKPRKHIFLAIKCKNLVEHESNHREISTDESSDILNYSNSKKKYYTDIQDKLAFDD